LSLVNVHIESIIQEQEKQEPEVIQQEVLGRLERKAEEWVIRYIEHAGTPDEVRTSVKSLPKQITIIRHGAVSYRQTYQPGETTESIIHTPAGKTEMDVTTIDYQRELNGEVGQIRLSFHLNMGSQHLGYYQLQFKWTEELER
jgi:uncharacterized beta-barrel protein YwiB (DUF1934 family)